MSAYKRQSQAIINTSKGRGTDNWEDDPSMTKDSEALAQAVSAARAVIAYDGAIQTYWARPDSPLIEWGITGIDGVAVEPDYRITHRVTGR